MIDIIGNRFFSSSYLLRDTKIVKYENDAETTIDHILRDYTDAGFPFCRIYPEFVKTGYDDRKLILLIDEGKRVIIEACQYNIRGRTSPGPIKKIADFKPDNYFSRSVIARIKKNLFKTGVFSSIEDNIVLRNDRYFIMFEVIEKPCDNLIAYGAFNEDNYDFSVIYNTLNLLGTLRRLSFQYDYQTLFALDFTEPILLYPMSLNGNFSLWTYDSVRLMKIAGKVTAPISEHFNISIVSGLESFSYFGNDTLDQQHSDNFVGMGLSSDHGALSWSSIQNINFEYLFRTHDRWQLKYDGEFWFMNFSIRPHYYHSKTDSFEYFDYFWIGGARDLRGYFEEEFYVKQAVWVNLEFKKLFIFPLFDIGWLEDELKYSYGFGLTTVSNVVDAAIIFAWPKQGKWLDGKIHLKLEKGF
jgi:outer membrane protein assembly factor BamA